jgi:two-component system, LuxR family, sensor kinase FixL
MRMADAAPTADAAANGRAARRSDTALAAAALAALAGALAVGVATGPGAVLLALAAAAGGAAAARHRSRGAGAAVLQRAIATVERERGLAVDAAARHAADWRAIVDTATEGIVTIDERGRIESVNGAAQRLFGYAAGELLGENVAVLMPAPHRTEHDGYLRRYVATGERRIIGIGREVVARRKDGSEFPIDLAVGEGWTHGRRFFTAVIRDASDRRDMQMKLAQAERLAAVGELASGIAHEINNPINTIINCAQLIQDGDDVETNCVVIHEEGRRIADIVRDLLQFARDDRQRAQPTSIADAVDRTMRLVGENWKRHGIVVCVDVPPDLPAVQARPQQLQQVLLNLLINAKDAVAAGAREDRRVWLTAVPHGNGVAITVRDNGPGVAPQVAGRIFQPFVTTKRGRGGTGLGLSVSKSIVETYGGTIELVDAARPGAEFRVWLPLAAAE